MLKTLFKRGIGWHNGLYSVLIYGNGNIGRILSQQKLSKFRLQANSHLWAPASTSLMYCTLYRIMRHSIQWINKSHNPSLLPSHLASVIHIGLNIIFYGYCKLLYCPPKAWMCTDRFEFVSTLVFLIFFNPWLMHVLTDTIILTLQLLTKIYMTLVIQF